MHRTVASCLKNYLQISATVTNLSTLIIIRITDSQKGRTKSQNQIRSNELKSTSYPEWLKQPPILTPVCTSKEKGVV